MYYTVYDNSCIIYNHIYIYTHIFGGAHHRVAELVDRRVLINVNDTNYC